MFINQIGLLEARVRIQLNAAAEDDVLGRRFVSVHFAAGSGLRSSDLSLPIDVKMKRGPSSLTERYKSARSPSVE